MGPDPRQGDRDSDAARQQPAPDQPAEPRPGYGPAEPPGRDPAQERRVSTALALLLGWYVVFGAVGYAVLRLARPRDVALVAAPIALATAVVIAPTTLAVLAQSRRDLRPFPLATISALVGLVVVVAGVLIGYALR